MLQSDAYSVSCEWQVSGHGAAAYGAAAWFEQTGEHAFVLHTLAAAGGKRGAGECTPTSTMSLSCRYALACCVGSAPPKPASALSEEPVPSFEVSRSAAEEMWHSFWSNGAFADIAGRTADPRALEIERRVIQSLYLMRSQEAGSILPQESGLLYNSWTGKHHSEMRYWHQTWMPLWGRPELLARSDACSRGARDR